MDFKSDFLPLKIPMICQKALVPGGYTKKKIVSLDCRKWTPIDRSRKPRKGAYSWGCMCQDMCLKGCPFGKIS